MRVVVVGAGLGGLSAAAHLVGRGHDVFVIEQTSRPGGMAGVFANAGFQLDTGPSVLTMPDVLAEVFAATGNDMGDYVTIDRVDPIYRIGFHDDSQLYVRHGAEAMAAEIERFAGGKAVGQFERFAEWLRELYEVAMPNFVDTNYDSLTDGLRPFRAIAGLARLGGFGRLERKVSSFFDDDRLVRAFSFQSLYAGVPPHRALAALGTISYMDSIGGVYAPKGGVHAMTRALADAVQQAGATFRYEAPVTRIMRGADGGVTGVEIGGSERVPADAVVCNADLPVAYRTLLGGLEAPRVARRGVASPSAVLWVAGVRGDAPDGAARHNIHFGEAWRKSFDSLFDRGELMDDPSTLVSLHSLGDPSLAPPGCSTLYAFEPVPNLRGRIDWSVERRLVADRLRKRVASFGYPVDVVAERVIDPLDWEAMGLDRGTPFGLANTFRQSGPYRPNNIDKRVPGLVFTGSSTLPGVGVPMVLISGKLAAQRVDDYARETSVVRW